MPGLQVMQEASNKACDYVRSYGKGAGVLDVIFMHRDLKRGFVMCGCMHKL